MPKTIQIVVDDDISRAIRREAKLERMSISTYAGRLLIDALRDAGVVSQPVPKEQLPLLEVAHE